MNEGEKTIQVWAEHSHRKKKSGTYEAFMTNNQIMHLFSMSLFFFFFFFTANIQMKKKNCFSSTVGAL